MIVVSEIHSLGPTVNFPSAASMGNKVSGTNITARPSVHAPSADEPPSTSTPRDQTVVLPCGESCHVIGSSLSQFSSQMGLCAQQRKDLLVTKSDAKVPPACVADTSEGFFFFPFFVFLVLHPLPPPPRFIHV